MDLGLYTRTYEVEDRSWLGSQDGTDVTQTITLDVTKFTANTHYPKGYIRSGTVLSRLTSGLYGPYGGQAVEVQSVTITGTPTGGTFTLTRGSEVTAAIAYNAIASAVQTALEALPAIQPGDVTVTGGPGPGTAYVLTFGGRLSGDQPQLTATGSFTGGSSPAVTVTTGTAGGTSSTDGSQTAAGFLFNTTQIGKPGYTAVPAAVGAPLLWRGVIRENRLPANNGLDATAKSQLSAKFLIWTR